MVDVKTAPPALTALTAFTASTASTASATSTASTAFTVNDLAFMRWLIANGADVNAQSRNDESVLSIALHEGEMDVRANQSEGAELVDYIPSTKGADVTPELPKQQQRFGLVAHAATAIHSHTLGAGKNGDSLNRAGDIKSELVIPIMLRQVHSLVRITEAQARLTLSPIVTEGHVDEAVRLFLGSMMDAVLSQSGAPSHFWKVAMKIYELTGSPSSLSFCAATPVSEEIPLLGEQESGQKGDSGEA
ncbi:minichromosome maintenance protein 5 [Zalaria obscura]|uniref:Minichromosome maintenance protein 5 n=1 Tax=Zalaria obscura TaxID=2024903 RepID=A0ACC3SAC9_9PEZI